MEFREKLDQQRVKYIVNSYQLAGDEPNEVESYLAELMEQYANPLIELALVETLVDHWPTPPLPRGVAFIAHVHDKLKTWEQEPIVSTVTPEQFEQITGLNPAPIFGVGELPPSRPIVHPS